MHWIHKFGKVSKNISTTLFTGSLTHCAYPSWSLRWFGTVLQAFPLTCGSSPTLVQRLERYVLCSAIHSIQAELVVPWSQTATRQRGRSLLLTPSASSGRILIWPWDCTVWPWLGWECCGVDSLESNHKPIVGAHCMRWLPSCAHTTFPMFVHTFLL